MKKYKYKLNMLEPGWKMIKAIGIILGIGFISNIAKLVLMSYIFYGLPASLGIVLWTLLIIESHQDKVLNEQALQERRRDGED